MSRGSWPVSRRNVLAVMLLGLLVLGCAPAAQRTDNAKPAMRYPEALYISATGVSGTSLAEAQEIARAEVSAQISSSIEAETRVVAEAISRGEQVVDTQTLSSSISTRTRFEHAELIRIDKKSLRRQDGLYHALAYLSRREFLDILEAEYQTQQMVFRENAGSLPDLPQNLPAYTTAYGLMRDAFTSMAATACDIQAVMHASYEPWSADQQTMNRAEAERVALLRDLQLAVQVEDCPGISGETLAGVIRSTLANSGIGTMGSDCRTSGLLLHLTPSLTWSRLVGRVCALSLDGGLQVCDGDMLMELSLQDKAMRGDGRDPEAKLMQRVTPEVMSRLLMERLGHILPVF
jgi:hypothetical protein